jgi:hypothetical protein
MAEVAKFHINTQFLHLHPRNFMNSLALVIDKVLWTKEIKHAEGLSSTLQLIEEKLREK